ncbi:hypothetical protein IQ273_31810 [Nodosilinea sp. LEGE 07298]|uniref:hypothetical protein n=1 Tax=Nodosilinea sp. LEGE 07298 TaxID=2777970 RepID=UPI0018807966|nr:hypothetical protein [Nodosilinea sp. LEGE 07298]MBE9113959.1 hypothetical protein [Nodosilinea sp. LEGE 07298]
MRVRPAWIPVKAWEALPSYGNVYLLVRMLDLKGSGWASLSIVQAAEILNLARRTVVDYVRRCRQYGLFRSLRWDGPNHVRVFYSSLPKVAHAHSSSGGCRVLVEPENLKLKKAIVVEAIAKSKQQQSFYKQHKEQQTKQNRKKPQINTLSQVFGKESSHYAGGTSPILRRTQRFTFVDSLFTIFGTSQPTIAASVGRSERTVRRRLSNQYREALAIRHQKDLTVLKRTQLALKTEISPEMLRFQRSESFSQDNFFEAFGQVWRAGCNVYSSDLQIKGQRRVNKHVTRLEESVDLLEESTPLKESLGSLTNEKDSKA